MATDKTLSVCLSITIFKACDPIEQPMGHSALRLETRLRNCRLMAPGVE